MFNHIRFDIPVERTATAGGLSWPSRTEADSEGSLGGNRHYIDLRGATWQDFKDAFQEEGDLIKRIEESEYPNEEEEIIENELLEQDDFSSLMGLDIGVASTVVALSALRCIPATSCNGGAFGRSHHESHPLVLFCARDRHLPLLLEAAEVADIGLSNSGGYILAYSNELMRMRSFASALYERRKKLGPIVKSASATSLQGDFFKDVW